MTFETTFFYTFSILALTSAIFVIYSRNTIYSAFFLILVFINSMGLLLLLEVEFLAIMLIIIYVGAITILFLFSVMMLDIKVPKQKEEDNFIYLPIIGLVSFVFFLETSIMFSKAFTSYHHLIHKSFFYQTVNSLVFSRNNIKGIQLEKFFDEKPFLEDIIGQLDSITNTELLGQVLYNYYGFFLLLSGIILLIALIGVVILTKQKGRKDFQQQIYKQLSRNSKKAFFTVY